MFTVSRWYNPGDVNETGRMIALALATIMDAGVQEPRRHVFVARADAIATLVVSRAAFSVEQIALLRDETAELGFRVLVEPDVEPESAVLRAIVSSREPIELERAASTASLDLTVPTDNRPFFFNQLRFRDIPGRSARCAQELTGGVLRGNLIGLDCPRLDSRHRDRRRDLHDRAAAAGRGQIGAAGVIRHGTVYFALIGTGFMFAEISLLQFFGVFLGHPTYAMGVCLFSLILSTGLGSLASRSASAGQRPPHRSLGL